MQPITLPLYVFILIVIFIAKTGSLISDKVVYSEKQFLFYESEKQHSTVTAKSIMFGVLYTYLCVFTVVLIGNLIS